MPNKTVLFISLQAGSAQLSEINMTVDTRKTGLAGKKEAEEYLRVSRPTLNRLIKNGDLESRNVGTETRVTWHSVYVYLGEIESSEQ